VTPAFGGQYSIQLSYGRVVFWWGRDCNGFCELTPSRLMDDKTAGKWQSSRFTNDLGETPPMQGLMMDTSLSITSIMRHGDRNHGEREIISVTLDNPQHRYTYREAFRRSRKLANALASLGLEFSDRVATMAWNDYRHFELYYAVSCSGMICHTINPRLFADQMEFIINHAEDRVIFVDPLLVPALEAIKDKLPSIEHFVVMTNSAHMPETSLPNVLCYEELIADQPDTFDWPEFDENTASSLCYTSGTTGNPKGVLYSHRSTVLHALGAGLPDVMGIGSRDVILPVVPMFHVNAWATPYAGPMVGCNLVFPGPKMADGATLAALINQEKVTTALGVPTVWMALLAYCRENDVKLEPLERAIVGGAACPIAIMDEFRQAHDVYVHHAWGMTEMSPVGTFNSLKAHQHTLPPDERREIMVGQGRTIFGVESKITDDNNQELPWDGKSFGQLKVRGPWVSKGYYRLEEPAVDAEGWFDTGDVAYFDPDGFMHITDRTKDVIKSGGEWISSIELENHAVGHPAVAEAAVIGVSHLKWTERPLLLVVLAEGQSIDKAELLASFKGQVADWWIPNAIEIVDEIPHTATGKISKLKLREQFKDYVLDD
jgi:acyl-CoA synthetase (AMP-forming)/AMP-acid ligase II